VGIEVFINKKLVRVIFPIPRFCREQVKNPLVKDEIEKVTQNVERDSPETKLSNFLDLALQVENVITQQDYILSKSQFSFLLRFITRNEQTWIGIMNILTFTINIALLVNVSDHYSESSDYLSEDLLHTLQKIGYAQFAMSLVMLLSFMLGTTLVNINNGFKWKRQVVNDIVALPIDSRAALAIFKIMDDLIPEFLWSFFFMCMDAKTLYYFASVVFSALGCWVNVAFFSFHVLDIAMRIKLLGYVLQSVFSNVGQVVVTFFLGAVLTWIYAVIGVYCFGFNQYAYGDSPDYEWPGDLRSAYWQHLDFGLRGPPIFNEYATDTQAGKYIFDISYQILIIIIMVAIITGIIIDTFGELRGTKADIESDESNVCFVCSLKRDQFERQGRKFSDHIELEHNRWNYIYYKMYLGKKKLSELTAREKYMRVKMEKQSIDYFPIGKSLLIPSEETVDIGELIAGVDGRVESVAAAVGDLKSEIASLSVSMAALKTSSAAPTAGTTATGSTGTTE